METVSKAEWQEVIADRVYFAFPDMIHPRKARAYAKKIVTKAFALQKKAGTGRFPDNASRLVLSASYPWFPAEYLDYLSAEGVTTEDIESWWDQPDIFRWMDVAFDDWRLRTFYELYWKELWDSKEAWSAAYRDQPCFAYGPPVEHRKLKGENRPLPYELNDRYDAWLRRILLECGRESFLAEATKYETRNALFRDKIRSGEA